jgi:gas vesicle protein
MSNSKFSVFVKGALLGTVLGILIAPRKGSKTRKRIVRAGKDILDTAKEKASELTSRVKADVSSVTE